MKGLTHFMSGAALASFFYPAVHMAQRDTSASFILVLGGFFGIMPFTAVSITRSGALSSSFSRLMDFRLPMKPVW